MMPVNHLWGNRSTDGIDCQFGPEARVFGDFHMENSRIIYGTVAGNGHMYGCTVSGNVKIVGSPELHNSFILGNAFVSGDCIITNSCVADDSVVTDEAEVEMSDILGNSKVSQNAYVRNARLQDNVVIRGNARVIGVEGGILEIGGFAYLDRGLWRRPPLHFMTSCGLVVTESTGNMVNISCITNDVRKILGKSGTKYGRIMGLTQEEIEEVQHCTEIIAKETGKCY